MTVLMMIVDPICGAKCSSCVAHDADVDAGDDDHVGAGDDAETDVAGDGSDLKGGHWWDPCTFDYHHGHLGGSHFSHSE